MGLPNVPAMPMDVRATDAAHGGTPPTQSATTFSRLRAALRGSGPMAAVLGLAVLLVLGAGEWATRDELDTQWDNLRRSGEVQALALRGVATRYNYLPLPPRSSPWWRPCCATPTPAACVTQPTPTCRP